MKAMMERKSGWGIMVMMVVGLSLLISGPQVVSAQNATVYQMWDTVLSDVIITSSLSTVNLTLVNYTALAQDTTFPQLLVALQQTNTTQMNCTETKAFFLNAYNAFAMNLVIQNPCSHDIFGNCSGTIDSVREIGPLGKSVWQLPVATFDGQTYSLDDIENVLSSGVTTGGNSCGLDARIYSAIVSATVSDPDIQSTAFYPSNVDFMLNNTMVNFLNNRFKGAYVGYEETTPILHLSSIFYLYQQDFIGANEPIVNYISQFSPHLPLTANMSVVYLPFNWTLNGELSSPICGTRPCYPFWAFILSIAVVIAIVVGIGSFIQYRRKKNRDAYDILS